MPMEEARSRWEDLHNHVTTQTAQAFVTMFLNRVVRSNVEHGRVHGSSFGVATGKAGEGEGGHVVPHLSPQLLISKYKHSQRRLILVDLEGTLWRRDLTKSGLVEMMKIMEGLGSSTASLSVSGSNSGSSSSLGSASGSLLREGATNNEGKPMALPKEVDEAIEVLGRLAEDRKNEVWILSGLKVGGVLEKVAEKVPKVGIM